MNFHRFYAEVAEGVWRRDCERKYELYETLANIRGEDDGGEARTRETGNVVSLFLQIPFFKNLYQKPPNKAGRSLALNVERQSPL